MRVNRTTWLLVADNAKARLFESAGVAEGWKRLRVWDDSAARMPDHQQGTAAPTRGHKIGSGGRYAVDQPSHKERAGEAFIKDLARYLNSKAETDQFDQLVLAAPAKALSRLRAALHSNVTKKAIATWDKDLSNMPERELFNYCHQHLWRW